MAYYSTSDTAEGSDDFLQKLKTFLCETVGWTLHDDGSSDSQPYYVLKSTGESGFEDVYLQFTNLTGRGRIQVKAYQYWNSESHSGINAAYHNSYGYIKTIDSSSFLYWIFADLDHVFFVTKISTEYYGQYSGLIKRYWSSEIAITAEAVSAGDNVSVKVDDAGIFTENKHYMIKDDATIERIKITGIDTTASPHVITVESLVSSYAAGAKIGEDPQPVIVGYYRSPYSFQAINNYAGAQNSSGSCGAAHGNMQNVSCRDTRYALVTLFPWLAALSATAYQELRGELIGVFAIGKSAGDSEDIITIDQETYKVFNLYTAGWCAVKE